MNEKHAKKSTQVACDFCGEAVAIYFAAYGKHSCFKPACRASHETVGETYFEKIPKHPPIVPKKDEAFPPDQGELPFCPP